MLSFFCDPKELTDEQLERECDELKLHNAARIMYKHCRKMGQVSFESVKKELSKCEN